MMVMSDSFCSLFYAIVKETMICTISTEQATTCHGDSGFPLIYINSEGSPIQIGVVSMGTRKCKPGGVVIYTRLTSYLNWIQENINNF